MDAISQPRLRSQLFLRVARRANTMTLSQRTPLPISTRSQSPSRPNKVDHSIGWRAGGLARPRISRIRYVRRSLNNPVAASPKVYSKFLGKKLRIETNERASRHRTSSTRPAHRGDRYFPRALSHCQSARRGPIIFFPYHQLHASGAPPHGIKNCRRRHRYPRYFYALRTLCPELLRHLTTGIKNRRRANR